MMSGNSDMGNMLKDPSFMKSALGMMTDPKNKAMMDMMA